MTPTNETDNLLLAEEVVRLLRVSVKTLYVMRKNGELSYIPGNPVKYFESEVVAIRERKRTWHAQAKAPTLRQVDLASTKSVGQKMDAPAAVQRGREIWAKRRRS